MPSFFGHAVASIGLAIPFKSKKDSSKLFILAALCAVLPDADVIGFRFGIEYLSQWGHRGFTHSIVFSLCCGMFFTLMGYRKLSIKTSIFWKYFFVFFLCTLSHPLLDAMTTGGEGVAFFWPIDNSRYFFPFHPIKVSPIKIESFFSEWGLKVLKSEAVWIGFPSLLIISITALVKKYRKIGSN